MGNNKRLAAETNNSWERDWWPYTNSNPGVQWDSWLDYGGVKRPLPCNPLCCLQPLLQGGSCFVGAKCRQPVWSNSISNWFSLSFLMYERVRLFVEVAEFLVSLETSLIRDWETSSSISFFCFLESWIAERGIYFKILTMVFAVCTDLSIWHAGIRRNINFEQGLMFEVHLVKVMASKFPVKTRKPPELKMLTKPFGGFTIQVIPEFVSKTVE